MKCCFASYILAVLDKDVLKKSLDTDRLKGAIDFMKSVFTKKNFIRILWGALIVSLMLSFTGIFLRMENESNNKAIIPVLDYESFYKASNEARQDMEELLRIFSEAGTRTIALKETTLSDLAYTGEIHLSTIGEYLSESQDRSSGTRNILRNIRESKGGSGPAGYNPENYILTAHDPKTVEFIEKSLKVRFEGIRITRFQDGDENLLYIDAVLPLKLETGLGFDTNRMSGLKEAGFDIMLRPRSVQNESTEFLKELEANIRDFNVHYVIFDGEQITGYPNKESGVSDIFKRYNIITGIIEAPTQIRFVEQKGLEELFRNTGFAINRVQIYSEKELEKLSGNDMYHRWTRSVVDRNIRFIYIQPLKNPLVSPRENIEDTYQAVKAFNSFISEKGYHLDKRLILLSERMPSNLHGTITLLSELFGLVLYTFYLFGKKKYIAISVLLAVVAGIVSILLLGFTLQQFQAAFAAVLYPSLASLLLLRYFKKNAGEPLFRQIPALLGILLGVSLIGAYTVVTTLSDIRYTMNTEVYKGVLISFSIPLLLFAANYVSVFMTLEGLGKRIIGFLNTKVTYLAALIALLGAAVVFIYLARSGNGSGLSASTLELKIRDMLEETMLARPRFKEFLIGYPALFAAAYLYKKFRKDILLLPLGIAVAMGSVSVVNSFCHVFTAVEVSAHRTLNGFILGMVTGLLSIFAVKLCLWIYDKYLRKAVF